MCGEPAFHSFATYCETHKVATPSHQKKTPTQRGKGRGAGRKAPSEVVQGPAPVAVALGDLADELRPGKKGPPSQDETNRVLARVCLYLSIFIALALIRGDPAVETDEQKDELLAALQLDSDQSKAIVHPFSRLLVDLKVWKDHGRQVVEHADVIDAIAAAYEWGSSLARYQRGKARRLREEPVGGAPRGPAPWPPTPPPPPATNGHSPPRTFEERQGIIATPQMVGRKTSKRPE